MMIDVISATDILDGPISERTILDLPSLDDEGAIQRTTIQLATLAIVLLYIYKKICSVIEKLNRSEAVPGFPSSPNPHWLVGHLMVLRGAETQKKKKKKKPNKSDVENDEDEDAQVSTSFVRGYQRVYCDYADPETGRGSFWFFHFPCVSFIGGKDARKVMCSSSFRKAVWLVNTHTRQLLGQKTLLALMNKEWKYYRSAVHKSFTVDVVKEARPFVYRVGNTLADSVLSKIEQTELSSKEVDYESISDDGSECETLPSSNPLPTPLEPGTVGPVAILPMMKMATIDVFGLVALRSNGVDFGCTRDLELSPLASAFDDLITEFTYRLKRPWDPLTFLYSIPTKSNRDYHRKRNMIRVFIAEQIAQTRDRITKSNNSGEEQEQHLDADMLTNLIKAADDEKAKAKDTRRVNDKEHNEALGDILMTLLFAGYDTTSITLTYALYLLAKNPAKKAKCLAEIDAVFGSEEHSGETGSQPMGQTLPPGPEDLPYTKGVILETLRLFPPAPSTARTIEKPITFGGDERRRSSRLSTSSRNPEKPTTPSGNKEKILRLEKGQMVMLPIWSIHRSELNFPRPNEMIPERWVRRKRMNADTESHCDSSNQSRWEVRPEDDIHKEDAVNCNNTSTGEDADDSIQPANREAFLSFAAGARNCVGRNLAMEESVILLSCLVHKLSFELVSDTYEVSPSLHAVVQHPDDDLPMIIRPRQ